MTDELAADRTQMYCTMLAQAVIASREMGFTRAPLISAQDEIVDDVLRWAGGYMNQLSEFLSCILPGYWGNSCQTLSSNIFARLNAEGVPAEIILGNVIIQGNNEFQVTLPQLKEEFRAAESPSGSQQIHAWISLGGDTIIDAALPPRLVKHYRAPFHFNDMILIGRAAEFVHRYQVEYRPILVGSEFFAKTNPPDPMNLLEALRQGQR